MDLSTKRIGFAFTGSFCTLMNVFDQMARLTEVCDKVIPIFSDSVAKWDTRFVNAQDFYEMVYKKTGTKPITTICEAEPIGPKKLLDTIVIAPCTGNTLAKLANGITDTPVLMAVKAHLRNCRPVVIAVSSNDALGANAENIGKLINRKNIYIVPMKQDSPKGKPCSLVADFDMIIPTLEAALDGEQLQPLYIK